MNTLTRDTVEHLSEFGRWLSGIAFHLASFGLCLMVFGAVWIVAHAHGEFSGMAEAEAAFEECGEPFCFGKSLPVSEAAP